MVCLYDVYPTTRNRNHYQIKSALHRNNKQLIDANFSRTYILVAFNINTKKRDKATNTFTCNFCNIMYAKYAREFVSQLHCS